MFLVGYVSLPLKNQLLPPILCDVSQETAARTQAWSIKVLHAAWLTDWFQDRYVKQDGTVRVLPRTFLLEHSEKMFFLWGFWDLKTHKLELLLAAFPSSKKKLSAAAKNKTNAWVKQSPEMQNKSKKENKSQWHH